MSGTPRSTPTVRSLELSLQVPQVKTSVLAAEPPRVVSLKAAPPPVRTAQFHFAPPAVPKTRAPLGRRSTPAPKRAGTITRLRPPEDVVKLQDRLFYVLQPSLETWLVTDGLDVPFSPFAYQYEGIGFLYPRHGAVLADEMGLGKTMQAILSIRMLLHAGEIRHAVLVCPKPLISNWQREFEQWAPEIPVTAISGRTHARRFAWEQHEFPVKITNYESLLRDLPLVEGGTIAADLVVLDEAQRIKNANGSTAQAICQIPRSRSWALTGTPIENSTDDLVGLFEFVAPGLLRRGMTPRNLARLTGDYILRRTKDEVLTELPPKLFRDASPDLTPEQWQRYQLAESEGVVTLSALGDRMTIQHVFELIIRLKQICNFDPLTGASNKLKQLQAELAEIAASGKKAIVFSQWVDTLNWLAAELAAFRPLAYHGRISPAGRERAIAEFREATDRSVMLISYGAGSVGLNLQFTNYVFLFDRWWNPAVEDQAINRAHRIGSAGPVTITRFVTPGTIEQRIDDILRAKRELSSMILDKQSGPQQLGLSQDEIFGLFDLRVPRAA